MARNRQKAKQRKLREEAARKKSGGVQSTPDAGAPPEDEGQVKAAAGVDAAEEIKRTAKLKPEAPSKPSNTGKAAAKEPRQKGRFRTFLRSSWAELRRVQWPDRRQMTTMTTIVIGFVIIAGTYLGVIDWVSNRVVDFLLF